MIPKDLSEIKSVTIISNPTLWYQWYEVLSQDAPELCDQFIEETAAKMEVTVDYFYDEFLSPPYSTLVWTKKSKDWL